MLQRLKHLRVLVVEDEYFLANDLARTLVSGGAEVIGPVATACDAHQLVDKQIDAAVLDIKLADGQVFAIADELSRKHVPFVFATGYGPEIIPDRFQGVARLEKPYDKENVVDAVARLCLLA